MKPKTTNPGALKRFEWVGGWLVRHVVPVPGKPYTHRCRLAVFEAVAHRFEEAGRAGVTLEEVREAESVPWTQACVAIDFMDERGLLEHAHPRRRRFAPGQGHLDAMIEFHALREEVCVG